MGIVRFRDLGGVANAGLADGVKGRVHDLVAKLPIDTLFWLGGENPTAMAPYAEWKSPDGREPMVVMDVQDDIRPCAGQPALGLRLPPGAVLDERSFDGVTIFAYEGAKYAVAHKTVPLPGQAHKTDKYFSYNPARSFLSH